MRRPANPLYANAFKNALSFEWECPSRPITNFSSHPHPATHIQSKSVQGWPLLSWESVQEVYRPQLQLPRGRSPHASNVKHEHKFSMMKTRTLSLDEMHETNSNMATQWTLTRSLTQDQLQPSTLLAKASYSLPPTAERPSPRPQRIMVSILSNESRTGRTDTI